MVITTTSPVLARRAAHAAYPRASQMAAPLNVSLLPARKERERLSRHRKVAVITGATCIVAGIAAFKVLS